MGLITLIGIGIFSMLLVLLFFKLGEVKENGGKHFLLQLLVLGFILGSMILLGKSTLDLDNKEFCNWNKANETIVNANVTSFEYSFDCHEQTNVTNRIFYNVILWFVRVVSIYIVLYFIYEIMKYFEMIK